MSNAPIKLANGDEYELDVTRPGLKHITRRNKGKEFVTLRTVRVGLGKTQDEVAAALGIAQGEVSRTERREDMYVSTLQRYAAALGCTLEIGVVLPGGNRIRVVLGVPEPGAASEPKAK